VTLVAISNVDAELLAYRLAQMQACTRTAGAAHGIAAELVDRGMIRRKRHRWFVEIENLVNPRRRGNLIAVKVTGGCAITDELREQGFQIDGGLVIAEFGGNGDVQYLIVAQRIRAARKNDDDFSAREAFQESQRKFDTRNVRVAANAKNKQPSVHGNLPQVQRLA
jgi:hypothetical protein